LHIDRAGLTQATQGGFKTATSEPPLEGCHREGGSGGTHLVYQALREWVEAIDGRFGPPSNPSP
jgi:hypothetical protein